jgi:recombination protein RecA
MPPAKKKTRADILAAMNKKYADKFSIGFQSNAQFLETNNLTLNHLIGGGVPLGRITQFYGQSMSGKTTAALQTAAATQKMIKEQGLNKFILYLDYECALDEKYAKALGLDLSDESTFMMVRPDDFETGANLARDLIDTGEVLLAIWDSVPSMMPATVIEDEVGKPAVAPLPRVLAPFLGMLNPLLNKTNTAVIFINHVGEKIGGMPGFGPPAKIRPGGKALTYYSSVMVEFIGTTKEKGKVYNVFGEEMDVAIATETKMVCTKNKVGVPMREAKALVRYGEGFDNFWAARRYFEGKGLISGAAWITVDESLGGGKFNGKTQLQKYANENPEWRQNIIDLASKQIELEVDHDHIAAASKSAKLFPSDDPADIVDELS